MSTHKYEEAASRHAMEFDNETDQGWSKYSFLAGCDHVERVRDEVSVDDIGLSVDDHVTFLYRMFKGWSEWKFSANDVTWCEVKGAIEKIHQAALEIGRKLGREEASKESTHHVDVLKDNWDRMQAENKALKSDLEWAIHSAQFFIKHWYTDSGLESIRERDARRCDEIRSKHFKEEALKETGWKDE